MVLRNAISDMIFGLIRETDDSKRVIKVIKNRDFGPLAQWEVKERPDHFALRADGYGMPTEHTAKVLTWLENSGLKYFTTDSHFGEIRVVFFKLKDAAVFKLFWVK
jgi:hypothetical protein